MESPLKIELQSPTPAQRDFLAFVEQDPLRAKKMDPILAMITKLLLENEHADFSSIHAEFIQWLGTRITAEVDKIWEEKGYSDSTFE